MGLMVDRICAIGRSSGQMTVEFVAALPVLLAVAVISVNALTYFGWCAAFDDDFRDSVRVYAASPAYGQGVGDTCALIERALDERLDAENARMVQGMSEQEVAQLKDLLQRVLDNIRD